MFGIGFTEILVIGIILIIAVGPERMPGLLKAVLRGYREFRKATRELRASTGIDEILQDEELKELRSLRNPLYVPAGAKLAAVAAKPVGKGPKLTQAELDEERPPEGVDIAEVRASEREPDAEAAKRRAAKMAIAAREEEVVAAKQAAAAKRVEGAEPAEETEEERIVREKLAALEKERVAAKIMGAAHEDPSEHERIVNEKIAAAVAAGEEVPAAKPKETEAQRQRREAKEAAARNAGEK